MLVSLSPRRPAGGPAPPLPLPRCGVHELVAAAHGDFPALSGLAIAGAIAAAPGPVLWVSQYALRAAHGLPDQASLVAACGSSAILILVEVDRPKDALWAVEEGLRAGAVPWVVAEVEGLDFTASRRLHLAAAQTGVPAILLLPYRHGGASAARSRWRVSYHPSSPYKDEKAALPRARWRAVLERSRDQPHAIGTAYDIAYDRPALSVDLAAPLAADTLHPAFAAQRKWAGA